MEDTGRQRDDKIENRTVSDWSRAAPLLSNYPYHVDRIRPTDAVTAIVYTDTRAFEARLVPKPSATARLLLTDWMAEEGFRDTQRFIRTIYGDRMVPFGDQQVLYVTDAWPGHPLRAEPDEVVSAAVQLARVHRAMLGFRLHSSLQTELDEKSSVDWAQESLRTAVFFRDLRSDGRIRSHPLLLEWSLRFEEQSLMAHSALTRVGYHDLLRRVQHEKRMAWSGNAWSAQRRVPPLGRMVTLQQADPSLGGPMVDLAAFCAEVLEFSDARTVLRAIAAYKREFQADDSAWQAALAYAVVPHKEQKWMEEQLSQANQQAASDRLSLSDPKVFSSRRQNALALLATLGVEPRF